MNLHRAFTVLFFLLPTTKVLAGIVSYDADVFPDQIGWARGTSLLFADRTILDGWLVQTAERVPYDEFMIEQDDIYRRPIDEFVGMYAFFVEWRMETDGPRTGFGNVSPAAVVAGGNFGISYHFTIANDQIRMIRDNLLPILFVDIEPGVPHTYRLELYGSDLYQFYIDGELIDSGVPEGAYPTLDSRIVFGARAATPEGISTVRWDYIRYGSIPEPASAVFLVMGTTLLILRRKSRTL